MVCIVAPFFTNLFVENQIIVTACNLINLIFILYLLYLELIEIKAEGLKTYIGKFDNVVDTFMIWTLFMYNIVRMMYPIQILSTEYKRMMLPGYAPFLIIYSFVTMVGVLAKTLFYFKTFEQYGKVVALIYGVRKDVQPFLIIFMITILLFGFSYQLLGANFESGYKDIPVGLNLFLNSFEIAVGSMPSPSYTFWDNLRKDYRGLVEFMIIFIWTFWIFQQIVIFVILMNFLIALIN